jgi:hypothetical protein
MATADQPLVRAYTLKEMAALYHISVKSFKTWLRPHMPLIGEKRGRYYNTLQVRIIFDKLGMP